MEISEEVIARIVREVIENLNNNSSSQSQKQVLVIYTGGKIGFEASLQQLNKLDQVAKIEFELLFSDSAQEILEKELIQNSLEKAEEVGDNEAYNQIKQYDLVLVPVLTKNTAAKLSLNITDTGPTNLLFKALAVGIPIVAAKNAADLENSQRVESGMDQIPDLLIEKNKNQLEILSNYGIELIDITELNNKAKSYLLRSGKPREKTNKGKTVIEKNILNHNDIKKLKSKGKNKVFIGANTIVTPMAEERAARNGVKICLQQK